MSRVIFDGKLSGEIVTLAFSFLSHLATGETISSAVTTATVYSGTDASPSSLISGAASISGSTVSQKVIGGTLGVTYILVCSAVTSLGQTLQISGYLVIVP